PVASAEPILKAERISVAYGRRVAVREVSLRIDQGEIVALMGRNGSGKSTLLWALQGARKRSGGSLRISGSDPATLSSTQRRRLFGLVPQTAADLLYLETVAAELDQSDSESSRAPGTAAGYLDRLAPGVDREAHPRDLSEGQRLALVLAIVLCAEPAVIALDEPTRGLDYPGKAALVGILRDLADQGRSILVATHDVEFVAQVADRVAVLAEGELVSCGPTAQVVAESPAFAPQTTKIFGSGWLTVAQVADQLVSK
ncbi:MAG TPA: ATP-binding cassette domain-containing protein, partial [Marmoricola sp.]|nr:ATP-binding cassette domain-containing protein [Marmoricola sp.]